MQQISQEKAALTHTQNDSSTVLLMAGSEGVRSLIGSGRVTYSINTKLLLLDELKC